MAGSGLKATGDQIGGGAGIEVTRTVVGGRGEVGGAFDAVEPPSWRSAPAPARCLALTTALLW